MSDETHTCKCGKPAIVGTGPSGHLVWLCDVCFDKRMKELGAMIKRMVSNVREAV